MLSIQLFRQNKELILEGLKKKNFNENKKELFYLLFFCSVAIGSCKKFVEVSPPGELTTAAQLFADSATAIGALKGNYIKKHCALMPQPVFLLFLLALYKAMESKNLSKQCKIKPLFFQVNLE